ncbi:GAF domain-containing protein [Caldicellulosiruptoraceae bacterium PP1]
MSDINGKELVNFMENINNILFSISDNNDKIKNLLNLAIDLTFSDGGTIYLIEEQANEKRLVITFTKNKSINFEFFVGHTIPINKISIAGFSALTGETIIINNINEIPQNHPYRQFSFFDKSLNYKTNNTIAIPLKDSNNNIIGVFQLVNKLSNQSEYNQTDIQASLLLSNLVAMIIEKVNLQKNYQNSILSLQKLFSSMFDWMRFTVNKISEAIIMTQGKFIEYSYPSSSKILNLCDGLYILDKQIQLSYVTFTPFVLCMLHFQSLDMIHIEEISKLFEKETRRHDIIIKEDKYFALVFYNATSDNIDTILRRYKKVVIEYINQKRLYQTEIKYGFIQFDPNKPNQTAESLFEDAKNKININFLP